MSDADGAARGQSTYVESQVIMTTVRVVAPFTLTYGLFLLFHGADSPGGSFQGGVIIGATVLTLAFAFGIEPTREWLRNRTVVALAAGGIVAFTLVGLVPLLLGDAFLAHSRYESAFGIETKWGLEAVEIFGVAPIVAGAVTGLFFVLASGHTAGAALFDASPADGDDGDGDAVSVGLEDESPDRVEASDAAAGTSGPRATDGGDRQ